MILSFQKGIIGGDSLNIIKMPQKKSCSICCLAMLADLSFEQVMEIIFGKTKPKRLSMSFVEMDKALNMLGLKTNILKAFPKQPIFNMLCQCRSRSQGFWHYIVYDKQNNIFLDPLPFPWPMDDYKISKCIEIVS